MRMGIEIQMKMTMVKANIIQSNPIQHKLEVRHLARGEGMGMAGQAQPQHRNSAMGKGGLGCGGARRGAKRGEKKKKKNKKRTPKKKTAKKKRTTNRERKDKDDKRVGTVPIQDKEDLNKDNSNKGRRRTTTRQRKQRTGTTRRGGAGQQIGVRQQNN